MRGDGEKNTGGHRPYLRPVSPGLAKELEEAAANDVFSPKEILNFAMEIIERNSSTRSDGGLTSVQIETLVNNLQRQFEGESFNTLAAKLSAIAQNREGVPKKPEESLALARAYMALLGRRSGNP